jgi:RNA polymerase sigma factor (sigma-70 family)
MMSIDPMKTSASLLGQLQDWQNQRAWAAFVERYRPLIQKTCCQAGLTPDAVDEVVQQVLCKLSERLRHFVYDPGRSFRGWLGLLVRRQIVDHYREYQKNPGSRGTGDSAVFLQMDQQPFDDGYDGIESDDQDRLLHELALNVQAAVRARVAGDTWDIFWLTEIEGLSTKEAARRMGKSFAAAYMARQRVRRQLRDEGDKVMAALRQQGVQVGLGKFA